MTLSSLPRLRVDAVDGLLLIRLQRIRAGTLPFVVHQAAVAGVGKPDAAVRMHDGVVGRVERLALPVIGQHGDGAVVLVADHAAGAVFAGDLAALPVERVAVAVAGRVAKRADVPVFLEPAQLHIVRDVTPDQVAARRAFQAGPSAHSVPQCRRWIGVLPILYLAKRSSSTTTSGSG